MTPHFVLRGALALAAALLVSVPAQAQLFRAYLAIDGNDANPCTLPQPCRLLPAALGAVADGGEIWLLDSANYNTATVNIAKSVTILAVPGAVGSILANGSPAVFIDTAGVNVALRNIVIVRFPGSAVTYGINMTNGSSLTVEGSLVSGPSDACIRVEGAVSVRVIDSTIRCDGYGIQVRNGVSATITRSVISAPVGYAVAAEGSAAGTTTTASVADSTLQGSGVGGYAGSTNATATAILAVGGSQVDRNGFGLQASSSAGGTARLTARDNLITNGQFYGIQVTGAGARAWAVGNTVSDGLFGLAAESGGVFESAGDNAVRNNGTNKSGTIAVVAME